MQEFKIGKNEAGQRLDKYLKKLLPNAGTSFLYKMLRKKNIVWNGKKADGSEKITEGDLVNIYFTDETLATFMGQSVTEKEYQSRTIPADKLELIYEDDDIVLINKPAGMLSQKAKPEDISANEYLLAYLLTSGQITETELRTFKPAVCNRLDRNTTGLLIAGKSLKGLQEMSEMLKNRTVKKYYRCIVSGQMKESAFLQGYLFKDEQHNQVKILREPRAEAKYIETAYQPIQSDTEKTLIEVHLITGRSHQIRAHLASIGHPIIGDPKYGNSRINSKWKQTAGITGQLLHSYRMEFPDGRSFIAPLGTEFERVLNIVGDNYQ